MYIYIYIHVYIYIYTYIDKKYIYRLYNNYIKGKCSLRISWTCLGFFRIKIKDLKLIGTQMEWTGFFMKRLLFF